ncbi:MAG: 2-oxoacid:ferredoxin oxidoreductase subunit beta [Acidobacteriota bacterium]
MPDRLNHIGLAPADYRGAKTTLCAGCGHNAISERIIDACFELGLQPHRVVKLSGIGCSSKSPAYFLSRSFGFNSVHGRMPSVATGALLANRTLRAIGVSGDGDTASIGIGQFIHLMRRNLPLVYIVEDNGVYGLTKGQFSATADEGQKLKSGVVNQFPALDLCAMAIESGATFVARSFSGDKRQLTQVLKAALSHQGVAMLDIISPCVTFNDQPESTKSYQYVKQHESPVHEVDFIPYFNDITVDYEPGAVTDVRLHDGSHLRLRKLDRDYDPTDRRSALGLLSNAHGGEEVLTGVFYLAPEKPDFLASLNLVPEPLATLPDDRVRPPQSVLERINASLA